MTSYEYRDLSLPGRKLTKSQLALRGTSPAESPSLPVEHTQSEAPWPPQSPHTEDNEASESHC